ncbi:glycoside hydrolase family 65 protein [Peterkaempfera griseoplana]|uniref:glycoside hydrolase family 65 protein n=1 Tax=Peterkaempfera griseoplana TaxID=66896 RepID=UPI0006E32668|nr:glycosyl hydrolase family 65 protein [Peterkaempfera griseoplana]
MADPWLLRYEGVDAESEGLREALCAVGNGYVVTRGAAPESVADGVHYPGTYIAGCYHRAVSRTAGREVSNEDLVNCPNWLPLTFRSAGGGPWFGGSGDAGPPQPPTAEQPPAAAVRPVGGAAPAQDAGAVRATREVLELDLLRGVLTRRLTTEDGQGRITEVIQRRLAHMGQPHLVALETTLVPRNWSGLLEVRAALDGTVTNTGVARYRGLASRHLVPTAQDGAGEVVWLEAGMDASALRVAEAARIRVHGAGVPAAVKRRTTARPGWVGQDLTVRVAQECPVTVEKVVAVCTSRDRELGTAAPASSARRLVARAGSFTDLLDEHVLRWEQLWRRCRTDIDRPQDTGNLRLYIFHLLQTCSEHSADLDVGIPARGLHGEAYRGHVFWDELFILPFFNLRFPERSRAVLRHRHRRLGEARHAAREEGRAGAMFPWQSGSDGREETQRLHLNPRSGRWLPDRTRLQRHAGSAVAFSVWQYCRATGDVDFLARYGAELLLEVARFWGSTAWYDRTRDRYRITGVMGPDEYHTGYPWSARPGLDDNAYTNVMAAWVLSRALEALELLPPYRRQELSERLGLDREELNHWEEVRRRLAVPFHQGVISQFDGYERLQELDWDGYRRRYGDIRRLDRILEAEGDSPNRYKASKQADALMLCYLFSADELLPLLARLGCPADPELLPRTVAYYLRRTAHGSTLSAVVHSWVLARSDRAASWRFFREVLAADVHDIQGGTTAEGIHLGAMAGAVDLLQRCYTGLDVHDDVLRLSPELPAQIGRLDVDLRFRGHDGIHVHVDAHRLHIALPPGPAAPIRVEYKGRTAVLEPGSGIAWPL